MRVFEYDTEGFSPSPGRTLTDLLRERGLAGWELVSAQREIVEMGRGFGPTITYLLIWKREQS